MPVGQDSDVLRKGTATAVLLWKLLFTPSSIPPKHFAAPAFRPCSLFSRVCCQGRRFSLKTLHVTAQTSFAILCLAKAAFRGPQQHG